MSSFVPSVFPSVAAAALIAFTLAADARATVVVIPSLEEMTLASEVVAEVVVGDQRVVQEGGRIVTYTTVVVRDGIKGAKQGDVLEVSQLGGTLQGRNTWIAGAHRFVKGEELVFFGMHFKSERVVIPYGIGFGMFRIVDDVAGAKVEEVTGDVAVLHAGKMGSPEVRRYDSLPAFKSTLRRILAGDLDLPAMERKQKLGPVSPNRGAR
jgi:hypothetical protein